MHLALTNSPSFVAVWLACAQLGAWIVPSDPMAKRRSSPATSRAPHRWSGVCSVDAGRRVPRRRGPRRDVLSVIEVDEADVDLAPFGRRRVRRTGPSSAPLDRAGGDVHVGHHRRAEGRRDHAGQLRVRGHGHGRGRRVARRTTARSWCCRCSTRTRSTTRSPPRSGSGASVALMHTFSASALRRARPRRHEATHASLFAAPMRMILARGVTPETEPRAASSTAGTRRTSPTTSTRRSRSVFGCRPRQLYGMTETIPAVLTDEARRARCRRRWASSPQAARSTCRTATAASVAPSGSGGEVVVRGEPRHHVVRRLPRHARGHRSSRFADGWFRTGDRARPRRRRPPLLRRPPQRRAQGGGRERVDRRGRGRARRSIPRCSRRPSSARPDPVRDEVPVAFVVARDPIDPPIRRRRCRRGARSAWPRPKRASLDHPARRAAPHERGQDPQVPAHRPADLRRPTAVRQQRGLMTMTILTDELSRRSTTSILPVSRRARPCRR